MKKDILFAIVAVVIVVLLCYVVGQQVKYLPAPVQATTAAAVKAEPQPGKVVMSVNGEPVTDREFALFVQALPEQMQAFAMNPAGRREIAKQLVKLKVLEQEGRKLGATDDPEVLARMKFGQTNVFVDYALQKLSANTSEAELRAEYEKNKASFGATELSHIVVAYRGGAIPARSGEAPPFEQAMQKANAIEAQIKGGTPFDQLARNVSDDQSTAANGGKLGALPPGSLPAELQAAIDKLQPGQVSQPVRSQYGIHIFRVDSRHPQSYEDVKPVLQRRAQQTTVTAAVDRLQKSAKVDLDPNFFGAAEKPPHG